MEQIVLFHHTTLAACHVAERGGDFCYLFIWAVRVGSSFALRWVLQAPCGSQREVCVLVRGQKSLTAPGLQCTDMLSWGPAGCCASLELQGLALSHSTFFSHHIGGVIGLNATTRNTEIDAKEQLIGGNLFSQVDGSCSCVELPLRSARAQRAY